MGTLCCKTFTSRCNNETFSPASEILCGGTIVKIKKQDDSISFICELCKNEVMKENLDSYKSYSEGCKVCKTSRFKVIVDANTGKLSKILCVKCLEDKGEIPAEQQEIYVNDLGKEITKKQYETIKLSTPCGIDGCNCRTYTFTKRNRDDSVYKCINNNHIHKFNGDIKLKHSCFNRHDLTMNQFHIKKVIEHNCEMLRFICIDKTCLKNIYEVIIN